MSRHSSVLLVAVFVSFLPAGCLFSGHKKAAAATSANTNAEPDKILYDRALNDYKHGRYTEARLSLQTLINSYPDSEYLAKAKLAVADSYYKEGGTEGLTQAIAEYKDFETFFPFLEEAAYAQMQVAMAHYRMTEKADRDPTQARLAEQEFQTFLLKYPKNPLVPEADQRLRDVQEVLAEGDFDVAHFYYLKDDYRAAAARLIEVTNRYPLFSEGDRAHWMLGDIYDRAARGSKNEQERALWRTKADKEYAEVIREFPLSSLVPEAKKRLTVDSMPIPVPDPQALARAEYDAKFQHDRPGLLHRAMGVIKSAPDVSMAARTGEPDLNPPGEMESGQDTLQTAAAANAPSGTNGAQAAEQNVNVQTVSPESSAPPPANGADPQRSSETSASDSVPPPVAAPPANTNSTGRSPTASSTETGQQAPATSGDSKKASNKKLDKSKESSSKRKRGLKKLIPW